MVPPVFGLVAPPVVGLVALRGGARKHTPYTHVKTTSKKVQSTVCVLARSRLSTTPSRLWPAASLTVLYREERTCQAERARLARQEQRRASTAMAISLDPREEVRGAFEGRGAYEDELHESPNPSYVGNDLAMYSGKPPTLRDMSSAQRH